MPKERILFISLSNIGDAVMTTPVLQALHDRFPEARIDIVGDVRSSELFRYCPCRDRILHKDKRGWLRGGPALIRELRRRRYQLVVDLRTDGLAWFLRADKRLTKHRARHYGVHAVERYMGVIRSLHGDRPIPACKVWLNDTVRKEAQERLGEFSGRRLIGLGPGANWHGKIWPPENFVCLIEKVCSRFDGVILLGNAEDSKRSEVISEQAGIDCLDFCGRTSLLEAAALLEKVSVFVGNDSGLGHMASGVDTATLTLFGPGRPDVYRPWSERAYWLVGEGQDIHNIAIEDVARVITHDMLAGAETGSR